MRNAGDIKRLCEQGVKRLHTQKRELDEALTQTRELKSKVFMMNASLTCAMTERHMRLANGHS